MEIAEYALSPENYLRSGSRLIDVFCLFDSTEEHVTTLGYNHETGLFYDLEAGGASDEYAAPLFSVLDVDKKPAAIQYAFAKALPVIEPHTSTYCLETVIAPTKSCHVLCQNEYTINGELKSGGIIYATVNVPVFDSSPGFLEHSVGYLTPELLETKTSDQRGLMEIAEKRKYRAITLSEDNSYFNLED